MSGSGRGVCYFASRPISQSQAGAEVIGVGSLLEPPDDETGDAEGEGERSEYLEVSRRGAFARATASGATPTAA